MNWQGERVLIAVSEQRMRHQISALLHRAGCVVHPVADGLEALAELKRRRFEALLADYHLARLDGVRLLLLSRMLWPEVPVLLLSADLTDLPLTLKKQGVGAFISTPFASEALLDALRVVMSPAGSGNTDGEVLQRMDTPRLMPLH